MLKMSNVRISVLLYPSVSRATPLTKPLDTMAITTPIPIPVATKTKSVLITLGVDTGSYTIIGALYSSFDLFMLDYFAVEYKDKISKNLQL